MENANIKLRIQKRIMESRLVEAKNKTIDASAIEDGETYFIKGTQKYFSKDEKKWYLENTMGDTITVVEADNFKDAMLKFAAEGWLRKDSDYSTRIELFESRIYEDSESMDNDVAEKLAADLKEALLAFVPETNMLEVYVSKMLMTTVQVRFAKGKDKTVWQNGYIENDPVNLRLVILAQGDKFKMETAGIGCQLKKVGIAPITGKTGTRDQIIAHIVKWFSSNIDMINKPGLLN